MNKKDLQSLAHSAAKSIKTLQAEDSPFDLNTPRDREGSFEPQMIKMYQRRFASMDDKYFIPGCSTREIVKTFKEIYGADVSAAPIWKVTGARMCLIAWMLSKKLLLNAQTKNIF